MKNVPPHEAGGSVAANMPFERVCLISVYFIRKGNADGFAERMKVGHAGNGPNPDAVNLNETSMKMELSSHLREAGGCS